jgi:enterochelin esterase-like enzyme
LEVDTFSSVYAGTVKYRVYLPPCYGVDGRTYPTLYMLPGNIHTDSIWDELGLDEAAETGILSGTLPSLIIVMADGGWIASNTSGGPGSYETVILAELIPFIESHYCVWAEANGRALGGVSRGGYWALEIAFRHPEQFVSVGGHSAALYDIAAGPALNPQYTGINNDLGDLRIYFDIGAEDYLITNIRRLHEAMETADIPHTWVLNSGIHENSYWSAHVADYLAWYTIPWSFERETYPLCQN